MRVTFLCVILFLINTCDNAKTIRSVELNREFDLKFQETAKIKSENIVIQFTSLIQESRCPRDVQCITAGKAEIAIHLSKGKGKTEEIQLSTEANSQEISYHKYRIKLLDVLPYPVAGKRNDQQLYTVRLIISTQMHSSRIVERNDGAGWRRASGGISR